MCTKFHWSLIKNNEVIEVWNFFYKSAFRLVGLDGKIMDPHQRNFSGWYWGVKLTCIPNFSQIGQLLQKLSILIGFRQVGWLGRFASSDFRKISRSKAHQSNMIAYKKSSWYLKALKSYSIFFAQPDDTDAEGHFPLESRKDETANIPTSYISIRFQALHPLIVKNSCSINC